MKNISSQSRKRIIRLSKHLKRFIKPFPRYGKAINAVVLLAFVMLVVAGAAALTVHNKPTPIATNPTSSTGGNNCLLSNSGCSDSKSSSTPTPTTQPAQTSTPSTPATTTTPKSSTPTTSYPTVIDGFVWASPTCHYLAGYGEAYYRDVLVHDIWADQSSTASEVSSSIDQYNKQSGEYQYSYQQELGYVNNFITIFNNYISTSYSQYDSSVNSIGCTTTLDTTNIPQVPACTDLSGTVCDDSIWAISIPSLES